MSRLTHFLRQLQQTHPDVIMLGGPSEPTALNQWAILGVGSRQQVILQKNESPAEIFIRLQQALDNCQRYQNAELPFNGGLIMALGYEFYRYCDDAFDWQETPQSVHGWPTLLAQECQTWLVIDLHTQQLSVLSDNADDVSSCEHLWGNSQPKVSPPSFASEEELRTYLTQWHPSFDEPEFCGAVEEIQQSIHNGELYQSNLSVRLSKNVQVNPLDIFESLCVKNPSPFSACWSYRAPANASAASGNTPRVLISNSPERLFQLRGNILSTRPIAGTRGRGKTEQEDQQLRDELLSNAKERAEHLMLVDLERNDLGRVCTPGSVTVNELLTLETYSHVTHLVSEVTGTLRADKTLWDALRSLFPGGTITGCPKIRCVETLDHIEPFKRGFYTGSLGYIDAVTGNADFNILIRSLLLTPQSPLQADSPPFMYNAVIQAGAGIVADSIGKHEYRESLKKAQALLGALHACEREPAIH